MATNRVTGMYSGLDTEGLINQLMEAKNKKVEVVKKDQMRLQYKQEAWTDLNKKIKSLFSSMSSLRYESSYSKFTTNVSDESVASVITSDNAMMTTQSLKVNKLATSAYMTGGEVKKSNNEKATSGTLLTDLGNAVGDTIKIETQGGKSKEITVTAKMTLGDLTKELSSVGVNCNFDSATQRIFIGAKEAGDAGNFTISGSGAEKLGLGTTAKKITGEDAEIELNGAKFTSNSNTFEINGLTITAKAKTAAGEEVTLNTTKDTSAIYDMIKKFTKEYSELINEMDKLYNASTKTKYDPLTDEEKAVMSEYEIEQWETKLKEQILAKDSGINDVTSVLRLGMEKGFEINGKTYHLFDFGIETAGYFESADNEKNALHIKGDADDALYSGEENKLQKMIASDPEAVEKFFSQLTKSLYEDMDKMSKRVSGYRSYGSFYDDIKMKSDYSDFTSKITDMEAKLAAYEDKWYDKFSKMESAMAKMQSNQNAISSLIGGGQ